MRGEGGRFPGSCAMPEQSSFPGGVWTGSTVGLLSETEKAGSILRLIAEGIGGLSSAAINQL